MHPRQMLPEVVQPGPFLISAGTVLPKTHVEHLRAALRLLFVHALLVACEIIDRAKTFLPSAVWLIALEQLPMSRLMFPSSIQSVLPSLGACIYHIPFIRRAFPRPLTARIVAANHIMV